VQPHRRRGRDWASLIISFLVKVYILIIHNLLFIPSLRQIFQCLKWKLCIFSKKLALFHWKFPSLPLVSLHPRLLRRPPPFLLELSFIDAIFSACLSLLSPLKNDFSDSVIFSLLFRLWIRRMINILTSSSSPVLATTPTAPPTFEVVSAH
jgi:hypothetical protein